MTFRCGEGLSDLAPLLQTSPRRQLAAAAAGRPDGRGIPSSLLTRVIASPLTTARALSRAPASSSRSAVERTIALRPSSEHAVRADISHIAAGRDCARASGDGSRRATEPAAPASAGGKRSPSSARMQQASVCRRASCRRKATCSTRPRLHRCRTCAAGEESVLQKR